jgi:hypothetical protein
MADTFTTNLNLTKPEVGASTDTWGTKVNADLDTLDGLFQAGPALKLAKGGTGATTAAGALANLGLGNFNNTNSMGFRNRIINGDMRIDQRNAGASVTGEGYLVDRWRVWRDQTYSIQQSSDAPSGFANSLAVTKTNTTQSNYAYLVQYVEGNNVADFGFGTASAATVTVSFWVKSSITGVFSVVLSNNTAKSYATTYTINSANTWEQKSVTILGDTAGTWLKTNGIGLAAIFDFGGGASSTAASNNAWISGTPTKAAGSTGLGTTSGATFYITGVQLEAGSVASPFERRDYGRELMMCQRYYEVCLAQAVGSGAASSSFGTGVTYAVVKRATPTNTQILNNSGYTQSGVSATTSGYIGDTTSVLVYRTSNASFAQFSERFSAASEL